MVLRLAVGLLLAACTSGASRTAASGPLPPPPAGAESSTSGDASTDGDETTSATGAPEPEHTSTGEDPIGTSSTGVDPGGSPMHGDPAADVPELEALLDEIEGWATGTTGGLAGTIFVVDTLADAGDRSLRAALESQSAHWILFADGLDGTIALESTIQVGSDKTVDARGHAITIRGGGAADPFTALRIEGRSNVILVDLTFDDELEDWDQDSEGADGLNITSSDHVWIHHCSFARWMDGAIDLRWDPATGDMPHHISVTWSSFSRVYQALAWTADRVSFGHNWCDRVRRRCIKMIEGRGHSWNNVIADWNAPAIQSSKDGAQLYSQRNMFVPGAVVEVNERAGGTIAMSNNHAFGEVDFIGPDDDLDEQFVADSTMLARIDVCEDRDDACWSQLRATIEAEAGAR